MRPSYGWGVVLLAQSLWMGSNALALSVPAHTGLVVDQASLLAPEQRSQLEQSLRQFQQEHGPQIQLLTIPSLEGEAIENYSIRVADAWKLGDTKRDDGALLVVAQQDRQLRIEVGKGLEGAIPDAIAGRIVRDVITPYFKAGHYDSGVVAGLQEIARRAGGELILPNLTQTAQPAALSGGNEGFGIGLFPLLLLGLIILRLFRRRSAFGYGAPRHGLLTGMLLGSMLGRGDRSGGGFFGGSGGGGGLFGGGGGGGFNGGGASGRW